MRVKKNIIDCILYCVLFILPFIHINIGINVSDQGYNLANFEMFPNINETWGIATLAANLIGKLFTQLPFGHYMLGMNIYCTLLLSLSVLGIFYFLKKEYSKYAIFGGLIIAICLSWASKVALYQYISYYLMSFAVIILNQGIVNKKKKYLFFAGIILGINLFVRFPNILQTVLILVVLYAGILYKKQIKEVCVDCACCVGGYILVALPGIVLIDVVFGKGTYASMIENLFGMTDSAVAYSPLHMIQSLLDAYIENWRWFRWLLLLIVFAAFAGGFHMKKWIKIAFYTVLSGMFLIILRIFWYYGIVNVNYNTYDSIYTISAVFIMLSFFILVGVIIKPNVDTSKRLYAIAALLIMIITPLGSNNVFYTNYNNLYLIAPIVWGSVSYLFADKKNEIGKKWMINTVAARVVVYMFIGVVLFQTFMFHLFFVYGSNGVITESKAEVNNEILKWMRTSEENAEMLSGLSEYINENNLVGEQSIVYSNAPLVFYILEMDCAIGHTWPALSSYPNNEYISDLDEMEDYPIIIYETRYFNNLMEEVPEWDEKAIYINELLIEGDYAEVYRNEHYAVCIPNGYIINEF